MGTLRGSNAVQTWRSAASTISPGTFVLPTVQFREQMVHRAVVLFHLSSAPPLISVGDFLRAARPLAKAGEPDLLAFVHECCPQFDARCHRQLPNARWREFGGRNELILHTAILPYRRRA